MFLMNFTFLKRAYLYLFMYTVPITIATTDRTTAIPAIPLITTTEIQYLFIKIYFAGCEIYSICFVLTKDDLLITHHLLEDMWKNSCLTISSFSVGTSNKIYTSIR